MGTPATAETDFLTVAEVAARLRVSEPTVYRRIADGTLAAVRLGAAGPIRIPVAELRDFLVLASAANAQAPAGARGTPSSRGSRARAARRVTVR